MPDPALTLRVSAASWRQTMSAVILPRKKMRRFQRLWDKLRGKDRHKRLLEQAAERESELRDRLAERDWRIADLDCRLAQIDGHISPLSHRFRWDIPNPLPFDASLRSFYENVPTLAELRQDDWLSSPAAKELSNYFSSYPPNSLVSPASRAVMYHLTAARRPLRALEIGTYKAGTSEVIVHAMNEANCGFLFTIDPFGADRVPLRIARWPRSLQGRLRFFATDSGICLGRAIEDGIQFDLIFIDGNHEFEFAYFDLAGSARVASPGAIVVVDNISQPGPKRAVRKFLEDYPDWSRLSPSEPYPETEFSILSGPERILVNDQPKSFGQRRYLQGEVRAVEFEIARPTSGTGQMEVYCRTFWSGDTEELVARQEFRVNGAGNVRVDLPTPLVSHVQPEPGNIFRIETIISFRPEQGREPLYLRFVPAVYPAMLAPLD